jgi:hypothetical protein
MNDPKRSSDEAGALEVSQEEDWWKGWRLDEPADSLLPSLDAYATGATEDWWAGWHAALLREG